jgi:hypothetical protein
MAAKHRCLAGIVFTAHLTWMKPTLTQRCKDAKKKTPEGHLYGSKNFAPFASSRLCVETALI